MKRNTNLEKIKDSVKYAIVMTKYRSKCKKLNISIDFLSYLANNTNSKNVTDIIALINKSHTQEELSKNIFDYVSSNNNRYNQLLLVGVLLGNYRYYSYWSQIEEINKANLQNFKHVNKEKIISVLEKQFYDYIMNDNSLKNKFYEKKNNSSVKDLSSEISPERVNQIFHNVVAGSIINEGEERLAQLALEFIYKIVNSYTLDDILNNYDFIIYDMQSSNDEDLAIKREKYKQNSHIPTSLLLKIDNLQLLKNKLKMIDNMQSKSMLSKLNSIDNPYEHPDEIEEIYGEYELLFREDLISHLFVPGEEETLVEDYRDVKPQLIHLFIRNPEKFREKLEKRIIEKIIHERNNNNKSKELTSEEKDRYNKLLKRMEIELNQTQVNYSFDSKVGGYTDADGLDKYISDTSNQIAASVYSENYFRNHTHEMLGIGFNQDVLSPDAIVFSSPKYLTTNKGLNNIEYDNKNIFSITSACYDELVKNNGQSEVVIFRRGIDFDTKASYVFVAFDRRNPKYEELIKKGRILAKENNLKLVLYDTVKIKESYNQFIQNNEELNNQSHFTNNKVGK